MKLVTDSSLLEQKNHGTFPFPLLVSIESLSDYDGGEFLLHWHPEVEITLVLSGSMLFTVNQSSVLLNEGEAMFCNAGVLHAGAATQAPDGNFFDCTYAAITFDPKLIYGYHHSAIWEKYVRPVVQNLSFSGLRFTRENDEGRQLIAELRAVIDLDKTRPAYYEMDMCASLQKIWKRICSESKGTAGEEDIPSLDLHRFHTITSYIELHYQQKISLSDIASTVNLCESECCRTFRRVTGISIFEYLQDYRIKKACDLLAETDDRIHEVADAVGYGDPNHFSKVFRKRIGVSPRQYRCARRSEPGSRAGQR